MLNTKLKLTLSLASLISATALAQTQNRLLVRCVHSASAIPLSTSGRKNTKNPVDWFSWGADLRLRNEYMNNGLTLSDSGARHEQITSGSASGSGLR